MTFTPWVTKERAETWFVVWRLFLILGTKPSYPSACRPGGASPPPASSTFTTSTFPDPGFCSLQVVQLTFLPSLLKAIFLLMTGRASQCFLLSEALSRSSPGVSAWFLHCKMVERNQKDILWNTEIGDIWVWVFTYKIWLAYSHAPSFTYCLWLFPCYSDRVEDLPDCMSHKAENIYFLEKIAHLSSSS